MISSSEQGCDGLKVSCASPQASRFADCLRFAAMALRYFNAAGADPQREIGEDVIQKLTSLLGWKPRRFSLETQIANA
jgi:hypothetical protein